MVSPDEELSLVPAIPLDCSCACPALGCWILDEDFIPNFHPVGLGSLVHAALAGLAKVSANFIQSTLNGLLVLGFVSLPCCRDSISEQLPEENFRWRQS